MLKNPAILENKVLRISILGFGLLLLSIGGGIYLREKLRLDERQRRYETVLSLADNPDPGKVIEAAKRFFELSPKHPSRSREAEIIAIYEQALGHWVARNINNERALGELDTFARIERSTQIK